MAIGLLTHNRALHRQLYPIKFSGAVRHDQKVLTGFLLAPAEGNPTSRRISGALEPCTYDSWLTMCRPKKGPAQTHSVIRWLSPFRRFTMALLESFGMPRIGWVTSRTMVDYSATNARAFWFLSPIAVASRLACCLISKATLGKRAARERQGMCGVSLSRREHQLAVERKINEANTALTIATKHLERQFDLAAHHALDAFPRRRTEDEGFFAKLG